MTICWQRSMCRKERRLFSNVSFSQSSAQCGFGRRCLLEVPMWSTLIATVYGMHSSPVTPPVTMPYQFSTPVFNWSLNNLGMSGLQEYQRSQTLPTNLHVLMCHFYSNVVVPELSLTHVRYELNEKWGGTTTWIANPTWSKKCMPIYLPVRVVIQRLNDASRRQAI